MVNLANSFLNTDGTHRFRRVYEEFYLSASSIGSKLRSAVSLGSLNQDLMGIALSGGQKTAGSVASEKHTQLCFYASLLKRPLIIRGAADLMYCYCIYNRSFVVRISCSV